MSKGAIVIVGATGGIGSAIVRRAAKDGYAPLILMDRMGDALNTIASETGGHPIEIDLTIGASVAAAFTEAKRHAGLLYALVLAAGVVDNGKLNDLDVDRWSDVISVNLTGPFLCCLAARDWLVEGGRIVTLGSLAGRTGGVATGTAYAASKGGIEALTKSIAQELAPRRITVNCVAPGAIKTPMLAAHPPERMEAMSASTPLKRLGQPNEIAAAISYLLGEDAGFTTGSVMAVNGGLRMD
jgi:NAD(P)-dependent dehydrogenase (short-subunit alcohol dehydrogenase family)|tara:strand:- start:2101 stop:2823 length:723 start_codon:yes stop_codon:yes gene_type:complete